MVIFHGVPIKQQKIGLIVGVFCVLILPLWIFGLKSQGVETLLEQYILISTVLMAILFAVIAVKGDLIVLEKIEAPLFILLISIFTDIYALFISLLNSASIVQINLFFSIATILLFYAILEMNIMAFALLEYVKNAHSKEITGDS
jgi:hypothetical protein